MRFSCICVPNRRATVDCLRAFHSGYRSRVRGAFGACSSSDCRYFKQPSRNCGHSGTSGIGSVFSGKRPQRAGWCQQSSCRLQVAMPANAGAQPLQPQRSAPHASFRSRSVSMVSCNGMSKKGWYRLQKSLWSRSSGKILCFLRQQTCRPSLNRLLQHRANHLLKQTARIFSA